jgi:type VI secretion system secreted protein Hcp
VVLTDLGVDNLFWQPSQPYFRDGTALPSRWFGSYREATMARTAYVTITGARQGPIKGEVTATGREGSIPLITLTSQIATPFDQASGAVTGRRQHRPIVITKPLDQATPKLYDALIKNEVLTDVTIKFWRPAADRAGAGAGVGAEQQYFTIALTNAHR